MQVSETKQTLTAAGIFRARSNGPGFGIILVSHSGRIEEQVFVQRRNIVSECAEDFTKVETPRSDHIRQMPIQSEITIGTDYQYAFELPDGTILIGHKEEMCRLLKEHLEELFRDNPFVLRDVAEFLQDDDLVRKAKADCDILLRKEKS